LAHNTLWDKVSSVGRVKREENKREVIVKKNDGYLK
jgi:hypothetical protein